MTRLDSKLEEIKNIETSHEQKLDIKGTPG